MTSDKQQTQQASAWSQHRLRQLVENVEDYAIFVTDTNGLIENWNIGAERLFGYAATEAIGQHTRLVFTPEDCAQGVPEEEMKQARENGSAVDERWHQRKDGSRFFASGFQTAIYENDELKGYAKIARDLTERITLEQQLRSLNENLEVKVAERTLELQKEINHRKEEEKIKVGLLRKIVRTQEDERKRISRDLHDHLGQKLTALRLRLEAIKFDCKDADLCQQIEQVQEMAAGIDSEMDFLAWELRPASIDELGLEMALNRFVKEFSNHFNIPSEFHSKGFNGHRLLPEVEINLYRIAQEALNNIAKYAQATNVSVFLEKPDHRIVLIIEDNGVGFQVDNKANREKGLGLVGMTERAALIGGEIEIESILGSGTAVYARVPAIFNNKEEQ